MDWAHKMLLSVTDDFVDQFRSIGIVEALASIFKVCMCLIFSIFKYSPHVVDISFPSDLKFLYFIFLLIGVLYTNDSFLWLSTGNGCEHLLSQLHIVNLV